MKTRMIAEFDAEDIDKLKDVIERIKRTTSNLDCVDNYDGKYCYIHVEYNTDDDYYFVSGDIKFKVSYDIEGEPDAFNLYEEAFENIYIKDEDWYEYEVEDIAL